MSDAVICDSAISDANITSAIYAFNDRATIKGPGHVFL